MVLVDEPGTFVGKRGRRLVLKKPDGSVKEVPIVKITEVIISTKASLSTDVIRELSNNGVPILFVGKYGPIALLHPFFMHGTVITRREQMLAFTDWRGGHLAKAFVIGGLVNKARLLKYLYKNRGDGRFEVLSETAEEVMKYVEKVKELGDDLHRIRVHLMGLEGEATHIYYQALREVFPEWAGFEGREKRPPKDPVNAALSLGYTILNMRCLTAVAISGLEPFAGFLHTDRSGKPSLILDLAEEFRQPVVDRTVVSLFTRGVLSESDFKEEGGRIIFTESGKVKLLGALEQTLSQGVKMNGMKTTLGKAIIHQARNIVRFLLGRVPRYEPFTWRWW